MKSCPACHRTYEDDSLIYCLEDGTSLSAPFQPRDPQQTWIIPTGRDTDQPATEMLPPGYQAQAAPNSTTWPIQGGAVSPTVAAATAAAHQAGGRGQANWAPARPSLGTAPIAAKRGGGPWIAVSAVLAIVAVVAIGGVGYLVWSNPGTSSPGGGSNNANNRNTAVNTNNDNSSNVNNDNSSDPGGGTTNTNTDTPGDTSDWLAGTWHGEGKQLDGGTWSMDLWKEGDEFTVDYPNLKCSGQWNLTSQSSQQADFDEVITIGKNCVSGAKVVVEKTGADEIRCSWTYANTDAEVATADLRRVKSK